MDTTSLAIGSFFLVVNLVAFLVMLIDKQKSRQNGAERISEGLLFFMATFFGSFGVYAGMLTFRHKTKKWYFLIGIPLLMAENCAFLFVIYLVLSNGL